MGTRAMSRNAALRASCCNWEDNDAPMKWLDYSLKAYKSELEAPAVVSMDAPSSCEGSGVGGSGGTTTTPVVVSGAPQQAGGGVLGNNMVSGAGVDGVVSNPFAKESIVNIDVQPNARRDLCLESYMCCFLGSGGCAWFFKMPDCLGLGCDITSLCGKGACTCKFLQKPTFCEVLCHTACMDMSTCCSNKCENDDTCCTFCTNQCQTTYCCIMQQAFKCEFALMRTCLKCWYWMFFTDYRAACPPGSFAPLQCTVCGFGYRCYENGGCGCRVRADTMEDSAPAAGASTTTVVVVNQAG